ncbi:MAG: hypothetical protein JW843_02900, partial [Candidatus Aminicenantes bacterium]|nr:hypothetical protein [Candidatus Aminicenantes bacterium]
MIAPMKKVWLVLLERERAEALKALRDLGVVHVETARPTGVACDRLARTRDAISAALNIIPPVKKPPAARLSTGKALALVEEILGGEDRVKILQEEAASLQRDIDRSVPWGDFDPSAFEALFSKGVDVRLFEAEESGLEEAPGNVEIVILARRRKRVRLAAISRSGPVPDMPREFVEFVPPPLSVRAMREKIAAGEREIGAIRERRAEMAAETASLQKALEAVEQDLRFETVQGSFSPAGPVCHVTGYVPAADMEALAAAAKGRGWAFAADEPSIDDPVPTKVVNNRFVRMIDPVFEFLGTVPGYREFEISFWFLAFFVLFFAMIFNDGGYGMLLLVAALLLALKSRRKDGAVPDGIRLMILLSGGLVVWGALTGSWFAIPYDSLPPVLKAVSFWPLVGANPQSTANVQVLCFLIGVVQLSIARLKNIKRLFPNLQFIAQAGSLALIVGMLFFVLNLVVDAKRFPLPPYAVWLVAAGFAANLLFGAYNGNVLKSFLGGLQNFIPIFLGTVGAFADIVSYIRL